MTQKLKKLYIFAVLSLCVVPLSGADVRYAYNLDWSGLTADARFRKVTLKADIGTCSTCTVLDNGVPVPAVYDLATGTCIASVTGTTVEVTGVNYTSGGTGACSFATLHLDKKWAYSFNWDDSRDSIHPNALPIFQANGYQAGVAINTGLMGSSGYLSWAQLDDLVTAGWSTLNHSVGHLNINTGNVNAQLDPVKSAIEARYPGSVNTYFVYPFNDIAAWSSIRDKGYLAAEAETGENYVDGWPIETVPSVLNYGGATLNDSPWLLRRHQAYRDTPVSTWNSWLDAAASDSRARWEIAFSHQSITTPGFYDSTPAQLSTHLSYLRSTYGVNGDDSVWMAPSDEVFQYLLARENVLCSLIPLPSPTLSITTTPTHTITPTVTMTPTFSMTATITPTPCGEISVARVNAGGLVYVDTSGATWDAEQAYSAGSWGYIGGTADPSVNPISGTLDDPLFQTERWGNPVEYRFTLPNGNYKVRMLFAEVFFTSNGSRVFNVTIEGVVAVSNLDIFSLVGKDAAWETTVPVTLNDGVLNIVGNASVDAVKFSAIEIMQVLPCFSPTQTAVASATKSPSLTLTPTVSVTSSPSVSASPTATLTGSPSTILTSTSTLTATSSSSKTKSSTATMTPSATQSVTQTQEQSATATPTSTFSSVVSATDTFTASWQVSATSTPTSSATATPTLSSTAAPATQSPSTTPTPSPLPLTATPSGSATQTLIAATATPSPTRTQTALSPTLTVTGTSGSPAPTAYLSAQTGPLAVLDAKAAPNPNPVGIFVLLQGEGASRLSLRIYTPGMTLVGETGLASPPSGWNQIPLGSYKNLQAGLYYFRVLALRDDTEAPRSVAGKFFVIY